MTALDEGLLSFGQNIGEGLRVGASAYDKRKRARSFMDALLGTPNAAPNFAGPSAPGYSGAAAPANYTPSYSGGVLSGVPGMEKLGPLLSSMNPEDAQAFALPLLLKQFERKPTETYKPGDQVYAAGEYSKPVLSIPEKPKDAPAGYTENPDHSLSFIPGGPADPSRQGAPPPGFRYDPVTKQIKLIPGYAAGAATLAADRRAPPKPVIPGVAPIQNPAALYRGRQ